MCLIRTIPAGPALCQVTPNRWGPDTMADFAACEHGPGSSPRPFASAAARAGPPPLHHLHLQRLLVSARGRRWAPAQPEGHWAGSRLCKVGAPPSGWPRAPRVGCTRLLSSAGPPGDILASVGSSRGPWLVLGPSSGLVGGPSLEPRAASHVVQNFRLHLVLAPVRRLEVVLIVLVVLVLRVLCFLVPRSAGQLFFSVVSFGWAGEESWAKRQAVCVPSLAPGRTHTSCRWSQPEALGSWGPVYKYGCLGSSSREAALGSRTAGGPGTPVEKALQGTLRPRALKTSSPEEPRAAHGSRGLPRSVQGSVSVLFSTGLSEGGCVLKEAENPDSHQLHRGWWVWGAPSPSLGGTPERGPFACPPSPIRPAVQQGLAPLAHTPCRDAHPGEG